MALGKRLEALTPADLQALIDDAVSENREIEFKESVGGNDAANREFLAEVSSFANASGGDLLVGIREKHGVADSFAGIPATAADAEILRLESILRDGLDPRIPGIQSRSIPTPQGDSAIIVIHVPRSFAAPHMVTFGNLARFYSRNSAGKYQLDVAELRTAFSFADSVRISLRNFRIERLARITANDGPVRLLPNPKTVLHLIPLTAIDPSVQTDAASLCKQHIPEFRPIYTTACNQRINFDGAFTYSPWEDQSTASGYTQVFRNGAIEAVEAYLLRRERDGATSLIPSRSFEQALIEATGLYFDLMRMLGLSPPFLLGLSLLDVRGLQMAVGQRRFSTEGHAIDRDDLIVPEVLIDDTGVSPATILRPAVDSVWQAAGWPGSMNYDSEGVWHDR